MPMRALLLAFVLAASVAVSVGPVVADHGAPFPAAAVVFDGMNVSLGVPPAWYAVGPIQCATSFHPALQWAEAICVDDLPGEWNCPIQAVGVIALGSSGAVTGRTTCQGAGATCTTGAFAAGSSHCVNLGATLNRHFPWTCRGDLAPASVITGWFLKCGQLDP